jgi:hypothetical protein
MRRRFRIVSGILVAVGVALAALALVQPRSYAETHAFELTAEQSPSWTQAYCVPDGTLVTFAWHTYDGTTVTVRIWSTGLIGPLQYLQTGPHGAGTRYFFGAEYFSAGFVVSPQVEVLVELSFSINGTYLAGTPTFGPC